METGEEYRKEQSPSEPAFGKVRKAVRGTLRHVVDSSAVEEKWDEAHERIVEGLDAGRVRDALEAHREDWHRLAHALNITATTIDGTLMAIFGGWSGYAVWLGIPSGQHISTPHTDAYLTDRASGLRKGLASQAARGVGLLGIAAGVGAVRPAKLALEGAGYLTGVAGAPVARIVDRIVGRPSVTPTKEPPVVWYGGANASFPQTGI